MTLSDAPPVTLDRNRDATGAFAGAKVRHPLHLYTIHQTKTSEHTPMIHPVTATRRSDERKKNGVPKMRTATAGKNVQIMGHIQCSQKRISRTDRSSEAHGIWFRL